MEKSVWWWRGSPWRLQRQNKGQRGALKAPSWWESSVFVSLLIGLNSLTSVTQHIGLWRGVEAGTHIPLAFVQTAISCCSLIQLCEKKKPHLSALNVHKRYLIQPPLNIFQKPCLTNHYNPTWYWFLFFGPTWNSWLNVKFPTRTWHTIDSFLSNVTLTDCDYICCQYNVHPAQFLC